MTDALIHPALELQRATTELVDARERFERALRNFEAWLASGQRHDDPPPPAKTQKPPSASRPSERPRTTPAQVASAPNTSRVLSTLHEGGGRSHSVKDLAQRTGLKPSQTYDALKRLKQRGEVQNAGHGRWMLREGNEAANALPVRSPAPE
jgi:predicted Rossmann fold nucleotide-binding protein DprA/Smf involved in DNA uptake